MTEYYNRKVLDLTLKGLEGADEAVERLFSQQSDRMIETEDYGYAGK